MLPIKVSANPPLVGEDCEAQIAPGAQASTPRPALPILTPAAAGVLIPFRRRSAVRGLVYRCRSSVGAYEGCHDPVKNSRAFASEPSPTRHSPRK
jgi:hypothetical protein